MLTKKQKEWIAHLSNEDQVIIKPFDQSATDKFEIIKEKIQQKLGKDIKVEHHGATSLGISGQDEIDIYIPVNPSNFNNLLRPLTQLFGEPRSHYPLERARFKTNVKGKRVDVFLINEESQGWIDCLNFEGELRSHPSDLNEYRKLKEEGSGLSTREYYRRKIEFINTILKLSD